MNFFKKKPKNFFICTVQRSGKSWLCSILTRLKHFGAPEEYLLQISRTNEVPADRNSIHSLFLEKSFPGIRESVQNITEKRTGKALPMGLAIQSHQMHLLAKRTSLAPFEAFKRLRREFDDPVIFFLKRKDTAAQAVSHYFMAESGIAHSYQSASEKAETYKNIQYNQEKITEWYNFTMNGYKFWERIFLRNRIVPKLLIYENLRNSPCEVISEMANYINNYVEISCEDIITASGAGYKKLSIDKKEKFVEIFKGSLL